MSDQSIDAAGKKIESPSNGTGADSSHQPEADTIEKRAAGWQRSFNNERLEHMTTKKMMEELAQQNIEKENVIKKAQADLEAQAAQINEYREKYTKEQIERERLGLIVTEFPDLLKFLGGKKEDGTIEPDLLPRLSTADEMRAALKVFSSKIGQVQKDPPADKKNLDGAPPPPPTDQSKLSKKELLDHAITALRSGDTVLYDKLMNDYYSKK